MVFRIIEARSDAWKQMSMKNLKIPYSIDCFFKWAEIVEEQGRICQKSGDEQKHKFIQGLPEFFSSHAAQMEKDKIVYPATYGLMSGFTSAPHAAMAHPMAGKPWITQMARSYINQWCNEISEVHKYVPSGMVRAVDLHLVEDDIALLNLLAKDVTSSTECYVCNGKGHAASQLLADGTTIECANKHLMKLGIITSIKDPFSALKKKYAKQSEAIDILKHENAELHDAYSNILPLPIPNPRDSRDTRRNGARTLHATTSETEESEHDSDGDDNDDVASNESGESFIASMANSTLQSGLNKSNSRFKRKSSIKRH